jgi:glycosyltransferase involved in cell wall biosynthesis
MFRPDLYVTLWSALGKCSRLKKISTIHQFIDHDFKIQHPYWKAKLASKLWHSLLKKFDTLVTLNELMLQTYVSKYPKNCVVKVHNGISPDEITDEIPETDHLELIEFIQNRICLGAAAQLTKNKGFHQVIDMLKLDENLCFVLIGDGAQLENLKLQASRNKVENQVLFFGKKNNAKKFFSYFDVFMMTSEREGFPMSLLEAASMSVPSVCADNLIFRNIFSSEEVSFFEQNNPQSLYGAVMNTYKKKLNFASYFNKRFLADYTSQKMAMNYLSIYNYITKKK